MKRESEEDVCEHMQKTIDSEHQHIYSRGKDRKVLKKPLNLLIHQEYSSYVVMNCVFPLRTLCMHARTYTRQGLSLI